MKYTLHVWLQDFPEFLASPDFPVNVFVSSCVRCEVLLVFQSMPLVLHSKPDMSVLRILGCSVIAYMPCPPEPIVAQGISCSLRKHEMEALWINHSLLGLSILLISRNSASLLSPSPVLPIGKGRATE